MVFVNTIHAVPDAWEFTHSISSLKSPQCVWLFMTPWTVAGQASLSITTSGSLLKLIVHRVDDAIQPSHPLSSPSPPAFNLSHHQGLFQWVTSSHQVAKVLELQLQHLQWIQVAILILTDNLLRSWLGLTYSRQLAIWWQSQDRIRISWLLVKHKIPLSVQLTVLAEAETPSDWTELNGSSRLFCWIEHSL